MNLPLDETRLRVLPEQEHCSGDRAESRRLTRREVMQKLLAGAGAAIAGSAFAVTHPVRRLFADGAMMEEVDAKIAAAEWQPEFLNPKQNEVLVAIAERMLPGAMQAQVNRIIDLLLSVDTYANRENFLAALLALDGEAAHKYGKTFIGLDPQQQDAVLATCASGKESDSDTGSDDPDEIGPEKNPVTPRDHFENLKGWIVGAYYATEQGMRELGWTEDFYFEELPVCQRHGEHSAEPSSKAASAMSRQMRVSQDGF